MGDIVEGLDGARGIVIDVCEQDDSQIAGGGFPLKYKIFKVRFCNGEYAQFDMDGCYQYTSVSYLNRIIPIEELKKENETNGV